MKRRPALLIEVLGALGALEINEAHIEGSPLEKIHGLQEGRRIWVNPAWSTVGTLLHEAIHALHPEWQESYVANRETFLLNRLSDEEVQQIYRLYQERARVGRRVKKAD